MAASTSTPIASLSNVIQAELPMAVLDSLPKVDPIFADAIRSNAEVSREGIGNGWKVLHTFVTSLAGAMKWVSRLGGTTQAGSASEPLRQSIVHSTQQTFPTRSSAPNVGTLQTNLLMSKAMGNFFLPEPVLKVDELSATHMNVVGRNIAATAKMVAHQLALSFYTDASGDIGTVANPVKSGAEFDFQLSNGRIRWFQNGMAVDVYDSTLATQRNSSTVLIVDNVDYLNKQVRLVNPAGTAVPASIVSGDKIVLKDSYSSGKLGPYGLDDWTKNTGTLFHSASSLALANYSQFRSIVDSLSAALTEDVLTDYISSFEDAYSVGLDTIITTRGVTTKYLEQPTQATQFIYQRQGQALQMVGGWSKIGYVWDGKEYQWLVTPYVAANSLYVTKLKGGNLKMYVPPPLPKAGKNGEFDNLIEFWAPVVGHNGIFMASSSDDGTASVEALAQAPFSLYMQMAPIDPRGIKLTSVTESTHAGSSSSSFSSSSSSSSSSSAAS